MTVRHDPLDWQARALGHGRLPPHARPTTAHRATRSRRVRRDVERRRRGRAQPGWAAGRRAFRDVAPRGRRHRLARRRVGRARTSWHVRPPRRPVWKSTCPPPTSATTAASARTTVAPSSRARRPPTRWPYGVIGVITPWNFPVEPGVSYRSGIGRGHAVIVKPSEVTSVSTASGPAGHRGRVARRTRQRRHRYGSRGGLAVGVASAVGRIAFTGPSPPAVIWPRSPRPI